MTDTCETCRFLFASGDGPICRRSPPMGAIAQWTQQAIGGEIRNVPITFAFYPPVRLEAWCGEYRLRLVAVVAPDESQETREAVVVAWTKPIGPHAGGGGED